MRKSYRVMRPGGFIAFTIFHPCFRTSGLHWEKDEREHAPALCVSLYFDQKHFLKNWRFGDRPLEEKIDLFTISRFPRTLSNYLNAGADSGFQLVWLADSQPSREACELVQRFTRWRDLATVLLLVLAKRPG